MHVLLLLDKSGSMEQACKDTGDPLYVALVQRCMSTLAEHAQQHLAAGEELGVQVDTFNHEHQANVAKLRVSVGHEQQIQRQSFSDLEKQLLAVKLGGGTAYYDAVHNVLSALHTRMKSGATEHVFVLVVTDGDDTCSTCTLAQCVRASAALKETGVHVIAIGSDDITAGGQDGLSSVSRASSQPLKQPGGAAAMEPPRMFTFERSSSVSVQAAFRNVSGQMAGIAAGRAVQKDEDMADDDSKNYVLVHGSGGNVAPNVLATAPTTPPPTPMQTSPTAAETAESTPLLPAAVRRVHTC